MVQVPRQKADACERRLYVRRTVCRCVSVWVGVLYVSSLSRYPCAVTAARTQRGGGEGGRQSRCVWKGGDTRMGEA